MIEQPKISSIPTNMVTKRNKKKLGVQIFKKKKLFVKKEKEKMLILNNFIQWIDQYY